MQNNQERWIRPSQYFSRLRGRPFWIWDSAKHKKEFGRTAGNCCFNHIVGVPKKKGIPLPLFDYEQEICDALEGGKHLWVKKATGLGITELILRYMAWLCLRDSKLKGSTMCIVTGPRIDLAIDLVERIKRLFPVVMFDTKQTIVSLNGVRIEAFPSHHLDSMRGLPDVSFVFLDEADFFPPGQQQDARDVSERYIGKSDPFIVMVSTPNAPGGLFEQIEKEHEDECLYHRIFLPYTVGVDKIYFADEIRKARNSPSFDREYLGKYTGKIGNAFHLSDIDAAIELGQYYDPEDTGGNLPKSMGIDPGFGSSKFAVAVTQMRHNRIEVIYAEQFERPKFIEMIDNALKLIERHNINKVYVDAANPEVITQLKSALGERTNYDAHAAYLRSKKVNVSAWMKVIPVSFASEQVEMLGHLKVLLEKRRIAINSQFEELILSLRSATEQEGVLIKADTVHNDLLDALRLAVKYFSVDERRPRIFARSLGYRGSQMAGGGYRDRSMPYRVGRPARQVYYPDPGTKVTETEIDFSDLSGWWRV